MAVPDFQSCLLPVLHFAGDGAEHSVADAREALAKHFNLTEGERNEILPSGRQRRFDNRVAWARVYLERAGLLDSTRRAHFKITEEGKQLLATSPPRIDIQLLERYPPFQQFRALSSKQEGAESVAQVIIETQSATPEEVLEQAYESICGEVATDLLARVKACTPAFFESLVVELLLKMGYGGNRTEAGRAIGQAGDEGIDGIINEDRLGLDTIYIQAKRWEGTVGRPEVQKFVGALHGKRARKGVFITTGSFSSEARQYVSQIDPRIVLIDGIELAQYMLDLNLGVTVKEVYEVKRVDSDYFNEE